MSDKSMILLTKLSFLNIMENYKPIFFSNRCYSSLLSCVKKGENPHTVLAPSGIKTRNSTDERNQGINQQIKMFTRVLLNLCQRFTSYSGFKQSLILTLKN